MGGARWAAQYWRVIGPSPSHRPAQRGVPPAVMLRPPIRRWQFAHYRAKFCTQFGETISFLGATDHGPETTDHCGHFSPLQDRQWAASITSRDPAQRSVLPGDHVTTERCYLPSKETNIHFIQILNNTLPLPLQCPACSDCRECSPLPVCSDEHPASTLTTSCPWLPRLGVKTLRARARRGFGLWLANQEGFTQERQTCV